MMKQTHGFSHKMRALTLLLAAALCFCGLPVSGAQAADAFIPYVEISIAAPMPGATPSYTVSIAKEARSDSGGASGHVYEYQTAVDKSPSDGFIDGVKWEYYSLGSYETIPATHQFVEEREYKVTVRVMPLPGFFFSTNREPILKINGKSANGIREGLGMLVYASFTVPKMKTMANLEMKFLVSCYPRVGEYVDFEGRSSTAAKKPANITWFDVTGGKSLAESDQFLSGHVYRLECDVEAKADYEFSSDLTVTSSDLQSSYAVTNPTTVDGKIKKVHVAVTFNPAPKAQMAVTGVTPPENGAAPSFSASTSDYDYCVSGICSTPWQNGVSWLDVATNTYLTEYDDFVDGRKYMVSVYLYAYGADFIPADKSEVIATINGVSADSLSLYDDHAVLTKQFTCGEPEKTEIRAVSIGGIDAPVAGATPDYTAYDTSSAYEWHFENITSGSWQKGIHWYDVTAKSSMQPTDTFIGGHTYRVVCSLVAYQGYEFPQDTDQIQAVVNGKWADDIIQWGYEDDVNIGVEKLFECPLPAGWVEYGNSWQYIGEDGQPLTGWQKIAGIWYYFDTDGGAVQGWKQLSGKWYYFATNGNMVTGWQKIGGVYYYFNASGAMVTGWQKIGGVYYYFNASGAMLTGWQKIGGVYYYFNASGAMVTGWQKIGGVYYYFNASGAMVTGWQKIGGTYYYFKPSGAMVTGWQLIGGKYYYFNASGAMLTGWQKIGGIWYYFNASGAMQTGWQKIGASWYYFKENGAMVTGEYTIGGVTYVFNSNGVWQGNK